MVEYAAGFYRIERPFGDAAIRRTLAALQSLDLGFFPTNLVVSEFEKVVLAVPEDYDRNLIPAEYFVSPGVATLPLESSNRVHLDFTETKDPQVVPGSLVLQMTDETIDNNGWGLRELLRLFRPLITAFEPDYGFFYDELHAARPVYASRMFDFDGRRVPTALFWVNYYGHEWVANIGVDRLEQLRPLVPVYERLKDGGVLFAIQEDLYDERVVAQRQHQEALEKTLGLREVQAKFPNPGV